MDKLLNIRKQLTLRVIEHYLNDSTILLAIANSDPSETYTVTMGLLKDDNLISKVNQIYNGSIDEKISEFSKDDDYHEIIKENYIEGYKRPHKRTKLEATLDSYLDEVRRQENNYNPVTIKYLENRYPDIPKLENESHKDWERRINETNKIKEISFRFPDIPRNENENVYDWECRCNIVTKYPNIHRGENETINDWEFRCNLMTTYPNVPRDNGESLSDWNRRCDIQTKYPNMPRNSDETLDNWGLRCYEQTLTSKLSSEYPTVPRKENEHVCNWQQRCKKRNSEPNNEHTVGYMKFAFPDVNRHEESFWTWRTNCFESNPTKHSKDLIKTYLRLVGMNPVMIDFEAESVYYDCDDDGDFIGMMSGAKKLMNNIYAIVFIKPLLS